MAQKISGNPALAQRHQRPSGAACGFSVQGRHSALLIKGAACSCAGAPPVEKGWPITHARSHQLSAHQFEPFLAGLAWALLGDGCNEIIDARHDFGAEAPAVEHTVMPDAKL